jgi:hypothetical protein
MLIYLFIAACTEFDSREGRRVGCSDGVLGGSECEFSCDPNGWRIEGNSTLTCEVHRAELEGADLRMANVDHRDAFNLELSAFKHVALWDLPEPVCTRKTCPKLVSISNGQLSCTGNYFEDNCRFECNEGFTLNGADRASCTVSISMIHD